MKVLSLTRYSRLGASSRLRSLQYFPFLQAAGVEIVHRPLFDDDYLRSLYAKQAHGAVQRQAVWQRMQTLRALDFDRFDLIWLEKELFPWLPYAVERFFLPKRTPLLIDYDDAIFHNYDRHRLAAVRALLGHKIDKLMTRADRVIGGSPYLCERARQAGARRVEYLPTVVDLDRYHYIERPMNAEAIVIGWMGTPVTVKFLQPLLPVLRELASRHAIELRVVGAELEVPGVPTVCEPWSEQGESAAIEGMDIGIMPLPDSPWERGKCGYKLIQYMACGKPVVASRVGVNAQLVSDGINGYCAASPEEWAAALTTLIEDAALRRRFGIASRRRVEKEYCLQRTAPRLLELFRETAA